MSNDNAAASDRGYLPLRLVNGYRRNDQGLLLVILIYMFPDDVDQRRAVPSGSRRVTYPTTYAQHLGHPGQTPRHHGRAWRFVP